MADPREALVALLNSPEHAPMSTHDPRDGSCQSCPWPLHEMPPEDIADAILAAGWTPRGEHVKPSVEDVARALYRDDAAHERVADDWGDLSNETREWYRDQARAVLALFHGRTEAEVKAEALREFAAERYEAYLTDPDLPASEQPSPAARRYRLAADSLRNRADTIEKEADRG